MDGKDSIKSQLAKPSKGMKPSLTAAASKGGTKLKISSKPLKG